MNEPGRLIAQGRAADVYEYGDGLVLRRYRTDHFSLSEAAVMQHVAAHGYPVPRVVEVSGREMVMERIDGRTMLADLSAHPWRVFSHANTLASLVNRLHAIAPPAWADPKLGGGDTLVHMDLHPDNVLVTDTGPVVIDWSNAGAGPAGGEVADLWLLMSIATVPGEGIVPKILSSGRKLFVRRFMRHFDRDSVRTRLRAAGEWRLRDRNMLEPERERIRKFVERWATPA